MDYSSFNYFDVDQAIYYDSDDEVFPVLDEELYSEFEERIKSFKDEDVHKGLGYCPCMSRNHWERPNYKLHLFKDCAKVIYGLSCFHRINDSKQKLILAHDQDDPSSSGGWCNAFAHWDDTFFSTLVFRIDFVRIEPDMIEHDDADDQGRDGTDEIKRDWRKNLYGLVGARRRPEEEIGRDYPPADIVFCRDWDDHHNETKLSISADHHLLLNGPFLPISAFTTMLIDITLWCSVKSSEQTVELDVDSYFNNISPLDEDIGSDEPMILHEKGSKGAVTVGYSIISRAVYVRFVASIVIPSTTLPLDIYGHITVDEHFHADHKSFLFYTERDGCQHLKHGDYLTFYLDSMILREGMELTINVSLYQRSTSSTSKTEDIIFVDGHTSFTPSLSNNEEESQQEKHIRSDDDEQERNGINFMVGIIDPRCIRILQ